MSVSFPAIDGLRSLMNIWVVGAHVTGFLSYLLFYSSSPLEDRQREFLRSGWPDIANGLGFQVDVFFVMSGFLLSWNFLDRVQNEEDEKKDKNQHQNKMKKKDKNIVKEVLLQFIKRVFRLWPATIGALVLSWLIGDYLMDDAGFVLSQFAYPIARNAPLALVIGWSNRVDIICTTILFTVLYLFQFFNLWSFSMGLLAVCLSFVPKLWRFLTIVPRASYIKLKQSGTDLFLPMAMSPERATYYENSLFPGAFTAAKERLKAPYKAYVVNNDYFVFHQRITPFFIGMLLTIALREELRRWKALDPDEQKRPISWRGRLFHSISLFLACLSVLQPFLLAVLAPKPPLELVLSRKQNVEDPDPPFGPDLFVSCANRPLYAAAFAYFLYRAMIPADHPLHLRTVSSILSLPIFKYLATYSYAIYCTHNRLIAEVLLRYLPPSYFQDKPVWSQFLFGLISSYALSLLVSIGIYHWVEVPIQRFFFGPALKAMERIIYTKQSQSKNKGE